jgi:PAP2 superfamily
LHGIVHAAMYDAVIAIEGGFDPYAISPEVDRPASPAAAVAAAHDVLVARVPAQAPYVDARYEEYLNAIPDRPAKTNGIAVGRAVAAGIIALRADDGFDNDVPYVQPAPGPGVFEPTPPPANPVDVKLANVRPLTFESPSRFRPGGPARLAGRRYAADLAELAALGRADSTVRTPEQTDIARFWAENTHIQWNRNLRQLAIDQRLDLVATARMMALTHVAAADAVIGCFDAKYHYLFWRPVHAIARADTDGNPATKPDPTWVPLLIVNHPEYPSAHGCWTKAVTDTLAAFFGTDRVALALDSTVTGTSRTYRRFSAAMHEVFVARIYAGLHFRDSMVDGQALGQRVARRVVCNFFQPVAHSSRPGARPDPGQHRGEVLRDPTFPEGVPAALRC